MYDAGTSAINNKMYKFGPLSYANSTLGKGVANKAVFYCILFPKLLRCFVKYTVIGFYKDRFKLEK